MSVMRCPNCGSVVDTDFKEYDFEQDCCLECSDRGRELLDKRARKRAENKLLGQSMWPEPWPKAKNEPTTDKR